MNQKIIVKKLMDLQFLMFLAVKEKSTTGLILEYIKTNISNDFEKQMINNALRKKS